MKPSEIAKMLHLLKPLKTLVAVADDYQGLEEIVEKAEDSIILIESLLESKCRQLRLKDFEDEDDHHIGQPDRFHDGAEH